MPGVIFERTVSIVRSLTPLTPLRSTAASTTRRPLVRSAGARRILTAVALTGSLFGLAACGGADGGDGADQGASAGASSSASAPADSQAAAPEPDLEGIPDVVATVDGKEISGKEFTTAYTAQFQQMAMQAQMSGQEMDQDQMKKQLAESMVGTELLVQDAEAQGLEASEEDVDAFLEEAATSGGLSSVDELLSTLKEQGYDEEQLRSDARKQLLLDQSIEKMDLPQPTEEELKELYDSSVTAQDEASGGGDSTEGSESEAKEGEEAPETPSFEELKPQLEQQLTSQRQNEALGQKIEELKKDADVQIKL